jgi:hypothetical protein
MEKLRILVESTLPDQLETRRIEITEKRTKTKTRSAPNLKIFPLLELISRIMSVATCT